MKKKDKLTRTICNSVRRVADTLDVISEKLDERYGIVGRPVCSIPPSPGHPYKESLYVNHNGKGQCCGCYISIEKRCGEDGRLSWKQIPVNGDIHKLRCFHQRLRQNHGHQSESYEE